MLGLLAHMRHNVTFQTYFVRRIVLFLIYIDKAAFALNFKFLYDIEYVSS